MSTLANSCTSVAFVLKISTVPISIGGISFIIFLLNSGAYLHLLGVVR